MLDRPSLPAALPPLLADRVAPISGVKKSKASYALRLLGMEPLTPAAIQEACQDAVLRRDQQPEVLFNDVGVVLWFYDDSLLLGLRGPEGYTLFPWPLRPKMHCSASYLLKILLPFSWPTPAQDWADIADRSKPLLTWKPLSGGWAAAPFPAWAKDRKALERNLTTLFLYAHLFHGHQEATFHYSFQGSSVNDVGEIFEGGPRGRHQAYSKMHQRMMNALQRITTHLSGDDPAWFIDTWLCSNTPVGPDVINTGTLFSLQWNRGIPTPTAHDHAAALTTLPSDIVSCFLDT